VAAAVAAAIAVLVEQGARTREIEIPLPQYVLPTEWAIMLPEASAYHQEDLRDSADLYTADVRLFSRSASWCWPPTTSRRCGPAR